MAFNLKRQIIIQEDNGKETVVDGYVNEPYSMFAICKCSYYNSNFKWSIVHRTSESILMNVFRTKKDAERFFDYFSEIEDIDNLLFLNPHEKDVKADLSAILSEAYANFYREIRRPFG